MIVDARVPLHRLILSLSQALDHVDPDVASHQHRVAYIAVAMARQMPELRSQILDVFYASALHDIGLITPENRVRALAHGDLEGLDWHGAVGCELLRPIPMFARAARIIRHHHVEWQDGRGAEVDGDAVPLACHVLALADRVERAIDREQPVVEQAEPIRQLVDRCSGRIHHPDAVAALQAVSAPEAFWLDVLSPRLYSVLLRMVDWPVLTVDADAIQRIAEIFARIVDAMSRWTATHTAGVAATAVALAKALHFPEREQRAMRAAGYLHDLGKLAIPTAVLDKPGKLDAREWAAMRSHTYHTFRILDTIDGLGQINEWASFHHERLDGKGYPFRHDARHLTLGSRILAVADVFSALAEDRPYRAGMSQSEALAILDKMVASGALDGDVVAAARREADAINASRRQEQATYAQRQQALFDSLAQLRQPVAR